MEVPSVCPHCDEPALWELDLRVDEEIAWAAPHGPRFRFACPACEQLLAITFDWSLEQGQAARRLQLVGGASASPPQATILLVDRCPHGCGLQLGLQLTPDDPWAHGRNWPDEDRVLGGYRCPRCDGEGRLRVRPVVEALASPP